MMGSVSYSGSLAEMQNLNELATRFNIGDMKSTVKSAMDQNYSKLRNQKVVNPDEGEKK